MKRILKNKRGFTIAETVIALAIISTISISAVALSVSSQNASRLALQKQQAQFYAADIISCYRAGDDFKTNLNFVFGTNFQETDEVSSITLSDGMTATLKIENGKLTVTILQQEKILTSLEFTKGGQS